MIISEWEAEYWQTILEEAENADDEVAREEAMKHLHPVFPEDTELDETLDDESTEELNWLV